MADTAISITAGTGTNIDTRTEGTNGNHRQVIVIGDPATNAGVAPVDATAGVKVNLGADNDVTVTGTVAVTQSGTWDEVGINDSGNSITVDNGGTFAVQVDGSALTSLQLIDDTVATEGSAIPSKGILMHGRYDSTSPTSVDDGDAVPILTDAGGRPRVIIQAIQDDNGDSLIDNTNNALQTTVVAELPAGTRAIGKLLAPDIDITAHTNYTKKYYTNAGAVTDGIVWSPAAGKRWHVCFMYVNVSATATVTLEDDKAGGDEPVWKAELAANSGIAVPFPDKYPLASGEDAADLIVTTSAGNVYITITGYEI